MYEKYNADACLVFMSPPQLNAALSIAHPPGVKARAISYIKNRQQMVNDNTPNVHPFFVKDETYSYENEVRFAFVDVDGFGNGANFVDLYLNLRFVNMFCGLATKNNGLIF